MTPIILRRHPSTFSKNKCKSINDLRVFSFTTVNDLIRKGLNGVNLVPTFTLSIERVAALR
jgi:hypothetical protein